MVDARPGNSATEVWRFNPRAFVVTEWPYLLVLILALFGVAYTSFAKTPITTYWIVLAPFIGVICVISRWRNAENREQRLHLNLDAGTALGRGACGDASHIRSRCQPHDERRFYRACGVDVAGARNLHGRYPYCGLAYLPGRDRIGSWGPGHRLARAIGAASPLGCCRSRGHHCTNFMA